MDSFGINWFSYSSDGKTVLLFGAASVDGLLGDDGLPGWGDSDAGFEDQARGHSDSNFPLDEAADGKDDEVSLAKKVHRLSYVIGRNRSRKLSKRYEDANALGARSFHVIVQSTSERALGQVAAAAGRRRLRGAEVRLLDIP